MKIRLLFFLFCLTTFTAFSQKRYLAFQNLNWQNEYNLDVIEAAANAGCNAYELSIIWSQVYPKFGEPADWTKTDAQLAKAVQMKMKVAFRIVISRSWTNVDGFWKVEEGSMRDHKGNFQRENWNTTAFSYTHRPSIDKAKAFIKELCTRYKSYVDNGDVAFVTVVNSPSQELGFHMTNDFAGADLKFVGLYDTVFDYNKQNENLYRDWIEKKYKKIEYFNFWNNTTLKSFSENAPVVNAYDVKNTFYGLRGKDWYIFRHITLKNFIDEVGQTIKSVSPKYLYITSFGGVSDKISHIRGTLGFKDLCQNTDGIKVNDDIAYDHRFTMDIVRSNLPGKYVMNEVFFPDGTTSIDYIAQLESQLDENFRHGSTFNSVVMNTVDNVNKLKTVIRKVSDKWLNVPAIPIVPAEKATYKLSKAIDFNYYDEYIYKEWKKLQERNPNKFVNLEMDEDILEDSKNFKPEVDFGSGGLTPPSPTYSPNNNGSEPNINPIIRNSFLSQELVINRDFAIVIPSDLFFDPDGYITRIQYIEKPLWLNVVNSQVLLGKTPSDTGLYKLVIRAVDNRGGFADATYLIKVVSPRIQFQLIEAGYFDDRSKIKYFGEIKEGTIIGVPTAESQFNILGVCNIDSVKMNLELSGAFKTTRKSDYFPHSLIVEGKGFSPPIGEYTITAEAFYKSKSVAKKTINFSAQTNQGKFIDWTLYPNPCIDAVNLQLPNNIDPKILTLKLVNSVGLEFKIQANSPKVKTDKLSLDLLGIPSGKYFLLIETDKAKPSAIPFLKL